MTYKIYLQKQIWLPAAIDERKIEEKKLLTIVMRQFKIEGKTKSRCIIFSNFSVILILKRVKILRFS